MVDEVLRLMGSNMQEHGIEIERSLEDEDRIVPHALFRVMLNILTNAQDILLERGVKSPQIRIEGRVEGRIYRLYLCDNGGGVDVQYEAKIFDAYFTTKREFNGIGLGLYISKLITQKELRGDLTLENRLEGACFLVQMPIG